VEKKSRIIHLPVNPVNQANILSNAQRKLGYQAYCCQYGSNPFGFISDYNLNIDKIGNKYQRLYYIFIFFIKAIFRFDIFHFHCTTMLPRNIDLVVLKLLRKKMIIHYWGSEIRRKQIAEKNSNYVKVKIENDEAILRNIKYISKYVRTAIVADYELYAYIDGYFDRILIIPQAIKAEDYMPRFPSRENIKPRIIHAPTNKGYKGTEYILKAIARLSNEYDFEFTLVEGVKNDEAIAIYEQADIIIDQILDGSYGIFSIEAMALGKPVICYIREDLRDKYPMDLPIVSANPDTIYDVLRQLINDANMRFEVGQRGRKYVDKYHSVDKIAKELIGVYKEL